jgi:hypothetical protein
MNKTLIIASLLFALVSSSFAEEKKASGEKWKDTYFEKHPEADTNNDGELTWSEYKAHKDAQKKPQDKTAKTDGEKWKDTYFEKHPEADTNKDGELSWPELHQHKKESKTTQNI